MNYPTHDRDGIFLAGNDYYLVFRWLSLFSSYPYHRKNLSSIGVRLCDRNVRQSNLGQRNRIVFATDNVRFDIYLTLIYKFR